MASLLNRLTEQQWHQLSITDAGEDLQTDLVTGLSGAEVPQRLKLYGFNELQGKPGKSIILRFLMEFNQPLIYLLLLAGTVALLLQDWVDAGAILQLRW